MISRKKAITFRSISCTLRPSENASIATVTAKELSKQHHTNAVYQDSLRKGFGATASGQRIAKSSGANKLLRKV